MPRTFSVLQQPYLSDANEFRKRYSRSLRVAADTSFINSLAGFADLLFDEIATYTPNKGIRRGLAPTNLAGIVYWKLRNDNKANFRVHNEAVIYDIYVKKYVYKSHRLAERSVEIERLQGIIKGRIDLLDERSLPMNLYFPERRHRKEILLCSPKIIRKILRFANSDRSLSSLENRNIHRIISNIAFNGYFNRWYLPFRAFLRLEKLFRTASDAELDAVIDRYGGSPFVAASGHSRNRWASSVVTVAVREKGDFTADDAHVARMAELAQLFEWSGHQSKNNPAASSMQIGVKALTRKQFSRYFRVSI